MPDQNNHLSRQELVLAAENELPPRLAADIQEHLSACERCRARVGEMQSAISDFVRLHRQEHHDQAEAPLPGADASRARLKARLAKVAGEPPIDPWTHFLRLAFGASGLAYLSAGLLVAALGVWVTHHRSMQHESEPAFARLEAAPVPDPSLTPGVVRSITVKEVCAERADEGWGAISLPQQRKVFQEYGMANARPENYELDYLITPELGGANDIRNLWPEPRTSTEWNSYVKDDLENYLHQLVCEGKLDLATAQHDIATDWIFAYKKYFQTDRPLANHLDQDSDDRRAPRT